MPFVRLDSIDKLFYVMSYVIRFDYTQVDVVNYVMSLSHLFWLYSVDEVLIELLIFFGND